MSFFKDLNVGYKAGDKTCYSGRITALKNQYWHQEMLVADIIDLENNKNTNIGIIGYVCDTGVQRNQGLSLIHI